MRPSVGHGGRPRDRAPGLPDFPQRCGGIPGPGHVPCLARKMGSGCGQRARRRIQAAPGHRDGRWGARQRLGSPTPVPSRTPQVSRKPRSALGTTKSWRNRLGDTPCSQAAGPGLAWAPPRHPGYLPRPPAPASCQQLGAFPDHLIRVALPGAREAVSLPRLVSGWTCPGAFGPGVPWAV